MKIENVTVAMGSGGRNPNGSHAAGIEPSGNGSFRRPRDERFDPFEALADCFDLRFGSSAAFHQAQSQTQELSPQTHCNQDSDDPRPG